MKNFEARWNKTARHARQGPRREEFAPPGFATRVSARALSNPPTPSLEQIWQRFCLGTLATLAAVLAACAVLEWPYLRDHPSLNPNLENTVAQVLDRL